MAKSSYFSRAECPVVGPDVPQIRSETFRSRDGSVEITMCLTASSLSYSLVSKVQASVSRSIALDQILAASVDAHAAAVLVSFYPKQGAARVRCTVVFKLNSAEHAHSWRNLIMNVLATGSAVGSLPRRHVLVLVNPFGGTKKALKIWETQVKPLYVEAGITSHLVITQYAGHAFEVAQTLPLADYDGICTVSGDGLIFETVNGLLKRPDWEQAAKLPLLLIPGGSGNALCFASLQTVDPVTAAFCAARGRARPFDCLSLFQQPNIRCTSFLMLAWGLVADIDFESERWRWMGSTRFSVSAVQRIASLKLYRGKFSYLPVTTVSASPICAGKGCPDCLGLRAPLETDSVAISSAPTEVQWQEGVHAPLPASSSTIPARAPAKSIWERLEGSVSQGPPTPLLDALRAGDETGWVHEEGDDGYVCVVASNTTHISSDSKIAPFAHWSDGAFDLIILRHTSKSDLLSIMLNLEKGEHVTNPAVKYVKARAFRLIPEAPSSSSSILDVDGEKLPHYAATTEGEVHRGLLNLVTL